MGAMSTAGTPIVEMLWETADPTDVLHRRFGFADHQATQKWLSTVLERHWGVAVWGTSRIVMSDHNALAWLATSVGGLLAKWSVAPERFDRLSDLADLALWLGERGAPVSAPVATDAGATSVSADGALVTVQRVIEGDHLDVDDPRQVEAAGAVLARLHGDLARYPRAERMRRTSAASSEALAERVATWLDTDRPHIPSTLRGTLRELLRAVPGEAMPIHLVHGDYRAANLLCVDSRVAAVIDFEEARFDHPVAELARSAVMLGTLFRDWGPVSPPVREDFLAGYQSRRSLSAVELAWWDVLVGWYLLGMIPLDPAHDTTGWRAAAEEHLQRVIL
jgi:homoserine kinase type II